MVWKNFFEEWGSDEFIILCLEIFLETINIRRGILNEIEDTVPHFFIFLPIVKFKQLHIIAHNTYSSFVGLGGMESDHFSMKRKPNYKCYKADERKFPFNEDPNNDKYTIDGHP